MRSLATIVKVNKTEAIPNYDRIQLAWFDNIGYQAIVPVDVKVGDLVCWIEADSLLPDQERYEFLRKRCYVPSLGKLRIRVIKMAGQKSWGLVMQLEDLPPRKMAYKEGEDVTGFLGITKYEPAEDASPTLDKSILNKMYRVPILRPVVRLVKSVIRRWKKVEYTEFPTNLIPKTDETSIERIPKTLDYYKGHRIYITNKLEGQSATYFLDKHGDLMCCSRNYMYPRYKDNNYCNYAKEHNLKRKIEHANKKFGCNFVIQGELVGPGIQKNIYHLTALSFYIFNIYDQKDRRFLNWSEMKDVVSVMNEMILGLERLVPEIEEYTGKRLMDLIPDVKAAEELASRQYFWLDDFGFTSFELNSKAQVFGKKLWKDYFQHEGIVVRGYNQEFSFKVKNIDYADWFGQSN